MDTTDAKLPTLMPSDQTDAPGHIVRSFEPIEKLSLSRCPESLDP